MAAPFSLAAQNGRGEGGEVQIAQSIQQNTLSLLLEDLNQNIHRPCKQKITRKTILELIDSHIPYLNSFQGDPIPEND